MRRQTRRRGGWFLSSHVPNEVGEPPIKVRSAVCCCVALGEISPTKVGCDGLRCGFIDAGCSGDAIVGGGGITTGAGVGALKLIMPPCWHKGCARARGRSLSRR